MCNLQDFGFSVEYKADHSRELKKMLNMKVMVLQIVAGLLGTVHIKLENRLSETNIKERIDTIPTRA